MKILLLSDGIPPEGKGGAERIAWDSACALRDAGHTVSVITTTQDKALKGTVRESMQEGIMVYTLYSNYHPRWRAWISLYNVPLVRKVRRLLQAIQPDIVHAHNIHMHLSYGSLMIANRLGIPVFLTIHDVMAFTYGKLTAFIDPKNVSCGQQWNYKMSAWYLLKTYRFRYNPIRNFFIRRVFATVHTIFAVSEGLKDALAQNGIRRVQVLHNGISAEHWRVQAQVLEKFIDTNRLQSKKVIVFGGRISGAKGGAALLAALPRVIQRFPATVLLLMGTENDHVRALRVTARELGIEDHIRVTGWIQGSELVAAYHAGTVVVVPSVCFDSLPTVILEAMACEKPVIGSCYGGIPDIVLDGVTGYLVHPLATDIVSDRLITLLSDEEKAKKFGMAGALRQKEFFSHERHLATLTAAYLKACPSRADASMRMSAGT